jgi:hypothetical protein
MAAKADGMSRAAPQESPNGRRRPQKYQDGWTAMIGAAPPAEKPFLPRVVILVHAASSPAWAITCCVDTVDTPVGITTEDDGRQKAAPRAANPKHQRPAR